MSFTTHLVPTLQRWGSYGLLITLQIGLASCIGPAPTDSDYDTFDLNIDKDLGAHLQHGATVALKAHNDSYVEVSNDNTLTATARNTNRAETHFLVHRYDSNHIALESVSRRSEGGYVSVRSLSEDEPLKVQADEPRKWEKFEVIVKDDGIALRTFRTDKFVRAPGGGRPLVPDRDGAKGHETFTIDRIHDDNGTDPREPPDDDSGDDEISCERLEDDLLVGSKRRHVGKGNSFDVPRNVDYVVWIQSNGRDGESIHGELPKVDNGRLERVGATGATDTMVVLYKNEGGTATITPDYAKGNSYVVLLYTDLDLAYVGGSYIDNGADDVGMSGPIPRVTKKKHFMIYAEDEGKSGRRTRYLERNNCALFQDSDHRDEILGFFTHDEQAPPGRGQEDGMSGNGTYMMLELGDR